MSRFFNGPPGNKTPHGRIKVCEVYEVHKIRPRLLRRSAIVGTLTLHFYAPEHDAAQNEL